VDGARRAAGLHLAARRLDAELSAQPILSNHRASRSFTTTTTPFCTCTVGHESGSALFGSSFVLQLPPGAAFSGLQIAIQGAELFAVGRCPSNAVSFTDLFGADDRLTSRAGFHHRENRGAPTAGPGISLMKPNVSSTGMKARPC
jgi:hypothetical protein